MTTNQQKEALSYFKEHAEDWKNKALSSSQTKVNVIQQRNNFALHVIQNRASTKNTLDVGCGTGDLVCETARTGIDATGIDFASEMINIAQTRAEEENLPNAHFYCSSIFDFDLLAQQYDVISANGFIEYISLRDLARFLDMIYQALTPGGSFVVSARNRLFNIFSINTFTLEEVNNGTAPLLLKESIQIASGTSLADLANIDTAPLQKPNHEHAHTGIDVSIRYQFTPAQLIKMLKKRGYTIKQLYPIHIHGVPPAFKKQHPEIHTNISNLLQNFAHEHIALVPYASAFMLHAQKDI